MRQLSITGLAGLLSGAQPPCISLYQPTHRHHPDNQQDSIRYRNLLREVEASLAKSYPNRDVRPQLEQLEALARDDQFWNHRTDGLVVLSAPGGMFEVLELQRPVKAFAVVANSFHVKPLLRVLQSADRYQVLCMTRERARLFEGNRDALDEVELADVPGTITEALGEQFTEPYNAARSVGGQAAMHYGTGRKKDEVDIDTPKFFRAVDRAVLEHHSRPTGLPLLLAALPEHHSPFREVSRNPFLMDQGLMVNPESLTTDELRSRAWEAVMPSYLSRLAGLIDAWRSARARQRGSDDVAEVAAAAIQGRVSTLLLEADRVMPGRIDPTTGEIVSAELADPEVEDVFDDLGEAVLRANGEVVVVPAERMPTTTGAAATYRF